MRRGKMSKISAEEATFVSTLIVRSRRNRFSDCRTGSPTQRRALKRSLSPELTSSPGGRTWLLIYSSPLNSRVNSPLIRLRGEPDLPVCLWAVKFNQSAPLSRLQKRRTSNYHSGGANVNNTVHVKQSIRKRAWRARDSPRCKQRELSVSGRRNTTRQSLVHWII